MNDNPLPTVHRSKPSLRRRIAISAASGLTSKDRSGLTIVEVLVVIAIIGALLALILPAVQSARAAARSTQCRSNLRQLGLAIHSYHSSHGNFPPNVSNGFSMFVQMLPFMEQDALYHQIDFSDPETDANAFLRSTRLPLLICPADSGLSGDLVVGPTNYTGNEGTGVEYEGRFNGFFQPIMRVPRWGGGVLSARDISDGLSNTVAFSEALVGYGSTADIRNVWQVSPAMPTATASELDKFAAACDKVNTSDQVGDAWLRGVGWMRAETGCTTYNHVQTPNHHSCTNNTWVLSASYPATSAHAGGVNVCFGDGSSRFVSENVDRGVWRALGTRARGDINSGF
jgi:prepilin-type N-terminal cleavage/methylation domain-containing protein/prepilin-type processing-associated H-X9-DG protein